MHCIAMIAIFSSSLGRERYAKGYGHNMAWTKDDSGYLLKPKNHLRFKRRKDLYDFIKKG